MWEDYTKKVESGGELLKEGALLAADVVPSMVGGAGGGAYALSLARRGARNRVPSLLPALYGAPGVKNAAVRSLARAPGAVPGAAGAEYGYRRFLNPHDDEEGGLGPGGHALLAGGAELAVQGLSPAGHEAGKLAIWALNRVGLQKGVKLLQRVGIPGGFGGEQRVGADEAIELLHRLASTPEKGRWHRKGYISLSQTLENHLIEQVEGGVRNSLLGAPLWIARRQGIKTINGEGWHIVDELLKNGPKPEDVAAVLESVLTGSTQLHRTATRSAWKTLDRGLDDVAARRSQPAVGTTWGNPAEEAYQQGRDRVMVDLRKIAYEAEKWAKPGSPGANLRQGQMRIYNAIEESGDYVTFEDAHLLMSSIREGASQVEDQMPGRVQSMSKRIVHMLDNEIEAAGRNIPANVRYEMNPAGRGGAEALEEVQAGPMLTELFQRAKSLTKEGHEVFNESVLGPALKMATKEQFETTVVQGAKSPEMLRMVKKVIYDPRYTSVLTDMGRRAGIPNMTPDDLWNGIRGNWLNEHLIASMPSARTNIINGKTLYDRLVKNRVARETVPELFSKTEQASLRDFANALAAIQHVPSGAAGTTVITLMQAGAVASVVSSDVRERTGGWSTPVAFLLVPQSLAMMLKNPTVVRSFARGISGKVPASGVSRWMTQMIREAYAHDIPFGVVMPDGTKHEVDPATRKGGGSKKQAERRSGAGAFGEVGTAIPSP